MSPSDSSNQSEQVSTLPLPLLCPSPHDDRALVSSLFKTKPDTNDGQYPNYPTDEALILSNPDLLFSLDAEPETLPLLVQIYLSILGGDGRPEDVASPPLDGFITHELMMNGLQVLRNARSEGRGLFYSEFDAESVKEHIRYPFLVPREQCIELCESEKNRCMLPGRLLRQGLILTNVYLALPTGLPLSLDHPDFVYLVALLYTFHHPLVVNFRLPEYDYGADVDWDDIEWYHWTDDDIRDRIRDDLTYYLLYHGSLRTERHLR